MLEKTKQFWLHKPLESIVIIALLLRLLAAVFAQGYGMHDDHFLVIEASQSWVDGTDYNDWLPESQKTVHPEVEPQPQGHSFLYVGLHYLFFDLLKTAGIHDPKIKMLLVRIIHALFSLIVVILGFKITRRLTNEKYARQVGLLLAVFWAMPFLSVRNLVEVVCIPFLFMGIWYLLIAETKRHVLWYFTLAGIVTGLAFSIRFQSAFFIAGMGLYLLLFKKIKGFLFFGFGVVVSILAVQGIVDLFIWKRPFAEMLAYVTYNNNHKYEYGANNHLMYISLLTGLLIPPVGIFLFYGFLRTWKKYTLIFLPVILFILFHEYFPNKQERFILPVLPFYIMLGVIGWNEWVEKSKFWQERTKLLRGCWIFFWVVNFIVLSVLTLTYSKKSRIEAMYYFYKKEPVKQILVEDTNRDGVQMLPDFYAGQWMEMYTLAKHNPSIDSSNYGTIYSDCRYFKELYDKQFFVIHPEIKPQYALFIGNTRLKERIEALKPVFPHLTFETKTDPGFIDNLLYKLNPKNNKNETIFIYKIE